MNCRGLRLELVRGLGIALAIAALTGVAASAQGVATTTTLTTETRDQGGRTQAIAAVTVTGEDGLPATGAVVIKDQGRQLASAALNAEGQAKIVLGLAAGSHALRAAYVGDSTRLASLSQAAKVEAQASATPSFTVSVSALTPATLTAGQSGTATVSVTPENNSSLTAPVFVTISCSGLPDQSSCTFTPETVEILSTTTGALTSNLIIGTQAASAAQAMNHPASPSAGPIAWAFLLPGALCFAGLAWGGRRRRWLSRVSLLALVGLTLLSTTACNPRYNYLNHGPVQNLPTPAGNYTVTIAAQSNNGVTADTATASLAVVVK
jgi:hypothetical protein